MLNFDFLEEVLGIVSPPHFAYDFSKKNVSLIKILTKYNCPIAFTS